MYIDFVGKEGHHSPSQEQFHWSGKGKGHIQVGLVGNGW